MIRLIAKKYIIIIRITETKMGYSMQISCLILHLMELDLLFMD